MTPLPRCWDLAGLRRRIRYVGRHASLVLLATTLLVAAAAVTKTGRGRPVRPAAATRPEPAGVTVRVPAGWQRVHAPRTHVVDPVRALAVASFRARARSACQCGAPDIRKFPRNGAFVLMWEWLHPGAAALAAARPRPAAFRISGHGRPYECGDPSWVSDFREAGRLFQVDVYLGPATRTRARNRVEALLDGFTWFRTPHDD